MFEGKSPSDEGELAQFLTRLRVGEAVGVVKRTLEAAWTRDAVLGVNSAATGFSLDP